MSIGIYFTPTGKIMYYLKLGRVLPCTITCYSRLTQLRIQNTITIRLSANTITGGRLAQLLQILVGVDYDRVNAF